MPVNPQTSKQTRVRDLMSQLASAWAGITAANRTSWEGVAAVNPRTDSLGQTYFLTGAQTFVSCNIAQNMAGLPTLLAPVAITPWGSGAITLTATSTPQDLSAGIETVPPGHKLIIEAGPQRTPGSTYESEYRFMLATGPGLFVAPFIAQYTAAWGALITHKRIFVRTRPLNQCGAYGAEKVQSCIVDVPGNVPFPEGEGEGESGVASGKKKK
jgi:hypothetical protein